MDKQTLRRRIAEQKRNLSPSWIERSSLALAEQLFAHPFYQNAPAIYAYLSYNQEVRTEPILRRAWEDGKRVAVPKIYGSEMRFISIFPDSEITPGYRGIPEPVSDEATNEPEALMLMPGLAFTRDGLRMGYGGGFYDRFLAQEMHKTIALCYDFQLVDELPTEAHDVPVDAVLSYGAKEEER